MSAVTLPPLVPPLVLLVLLLLPQAAIAKTDPTARQLKTALLNTSSSSLTSLSADSRHGAEPIPVRRARAGQRGDSP
jgi:hypothetical protein